MNFLPLLLIALLPLARAQSPAVPETLDRPLAADPLQATIHRLSNGLTVFLSPYHQTPRVRAEIVIRAGGAQDPADSTGMAHYLEHMLFKGSERLGTLNYSLEKPFLEKIQQLYEKLFKTNDPLERKKIFQEIDGQNKLAVNFSIPNEFDKAYTRLGFKDLNAHTSYEETTYEVDFPANRAEAWAIMEAERFARPVFRLFQSEIETVYEEKNRSMDNAGRILSEALKTALYGPHPYSGTVLGSIEHLKNPSLAKMYAFYERHYVPNNMAVVLSGDFDRAEMLALLEKHLGAWKPKPLPERKPQTPAPLTGVKRVEVKYEAEEQVTVAWRTVPNGHPDQEALILLDMLMDNSAAGIINLTLNQAQKVKAAGSHPSQELLEAGAWHMWALPKQGQTLEQAEALLMEALAKLKAGEFTEEDIKAVITDFEVKEKASLESNEARAGHMSKSFALFEPWPRSVAGLDRLRAVTKADVLRAAQMYLGEARVVAYRRNGKPVIASIPKPEFTKIEIDPSRSSAFFKEIVALPAAPREPRWVVEDRDFSRTKTASGVLFSAPNPVNDLFSLTWEFPRGSRHERKLCAALDLLDLAGAGDLSAEQFKKKLYALGASLSYSCGEQESGVHLSGLERNLWASLELMVRRFQEPRNAPDDLSKMVQVAIGAHQDNKKNPGYVHHALGQFAVRGKESSVLAELSDKELSALKAEELTALMKDFTAYQGRIAYVGSRLPGEVARLIDFGRPRYLKGPPRKPVVYLKPARDKIYFAHRDMVQAQVGISGVDGIYDPERALDYKFFHEYLSGMSGLIFQEVREARSLAYAAHGGYDSAGHKGDENQVYGRVGSQADKAVEALSLTRNLLKTVPPSEERFRDAAKAIEESYRTDPITFRGIPGAIMGWEDLGFTGDPRPPRFEKALRYRLEDLTKFTGRFKDRPMTTYILGSRDRVGLEALKKLGEFQEKKLEEIFPY